MPSITIRNGEAIEISTPVGVKVTVSSDGKVSVSSDKWVSEITPGAFTVAPSGGVVAPNAPMAVLGSGGIFIDNFAGSSVYVNIEGIQVARNGHQMNITSEHITVDGKTVA